MPIRDLNIAIGHELLHTYQYNGTIPMNAFLNKPIENWKRSEKKFIRFYDKYFYTDFNYLYKISFTGLEILMNTPVEDRLIEIEPYYFGGDLRD